MEESKEFMYPVKVTARDKEEFDRVFNELKSLGYEEKVIASSYTYPFKVVTKYFGPETFTNLLLGNPDIYYEERDECEYNIDLFLALAAMVKGDGFHKGESIIAISHIGIGRQYTAGSLYTIKEVRDVTLITVKDDNDNEYNGGHSIHFRKATKEEIIQHFTSKQQTMDKEIIGYKFKPGMEKYEKVALSITENRVFLEGTYKFAPSSISANRLRQAGVLDVWFEPVLADMPVKIGDYEMQIAQDGTVGFGCKMGFTPQDVESYIKFIEKGGYIVIDSIKIGYDKLIEIKNRISQK